MDGIGWSTILANYGTLALALVTVMGVFWAIVTHQTRVLINETSVSSKTYKEEQLIIRTKIEQLEKSDAEFRVLKSQIDSMQRGQAELKTEMHKGLSDLQQDIQESADRQSRELNGAIDRVQRTMVDYTKALTNKT